MEEQIILLAVQAVEALLPTLEHASTGQLQKIVVFLEGAIPAAVQIGADAVGPIQNIIAAVQSHGAVTAGQVADLQAQSDALDAALDAAAKDDGLV